MRLLAFLLIITEIFILFNGLVAPPPGIGCIAADGFDDDDSGGDNEGDLEAAVAADDDLSTIAGHNHEPTSLTADKQDNIASAASSSRSGGSGGYDDSEEVIRAAAAVATSGKPLEWAQFPDGARAATSDDVGTRAKPQDWLSSSPPPQPSRRRDLDHHSSQLLDDSDVVAAAAAAVSAATTNVGARSGATATRVSGGAIEEELESWAPKSNPLIESGTNEGQQEGGEQKEGPTTAAATTTTATTVAEQVAAAEESEGTQAEYRVVPPLPSDRASSGGGRRNGKNIRQHPLFSEDENHEGDFMAARRGRRIGGGGGGDWCHRDCRGQRANKQADADKQDNDDDDDDADNQTLSPSEICASDGRWYSSMCELRRRACRHNVRLFRRPRAHCRKAAVAAIADHRHHHHHQPTTATGGGSGQSAAGGVGASGRNGSEEVRIVELKRRCQRAEYAELKRLLLGQFNGDVRSMFSHFDSNGDGFIEAHELWPQRDLEANKLIYAQVWDEHSSKCQQQQQQQQSSSSSPATARSHHPHHHHANAQQYRLMEDQSKCWFFLDFAFEPQFSANPCSLSHLMLFDLKHPSSRFSLDTFEQAFSTAAAATDTETAATATPKLTTATEQPSTTSSKELPIIRWTSKVGVRLGDSLRLGCLARGEGDGQGVAVEPTPGPKHNAADRGQSSEYNSVNDSDGNDDAADDDEGERDGEESGDETIGLGGAGAQRSCLWTRYNLNLATINDPHIAVESNRRQRRGVVGEGTSRRRQQRVSDLTLRLKDAQLYLSGQFKCACHLNDNDADDADKIGRHRRRYFEHVYTVQVSAEPRVSLRPHFQWSLPKSRVSFECHYDYIDTGSGGGGGSSKDDELAASDGDGDKRRGVYPFSSSSSSSSSPWTLANESEDSREESAQFGLRVKWLKNNQELVVDSKRMAAVSIADNNSNNNNNGINDENRTMAATEDPFQRSQDKSSGVGDDSGFSSADENDNEQEASLASSSAAPRPRAKLSESSLRASITMASSRLALEELQADDTGQYTCRVEAPALSSGGNFSQFKTNHYQRRQRRLVAEDYGKLLVQDRPRADQSDAPSAATTGAGGDADGTSYLWIFHDNGISIYRLQNDDGQEMELVREINGHSPVSAQVDGNWNQLTLCGGLNPEQVVICEWSDNALHIDLSWPPPPPPPQSSTNQPNRNSAATAPPLTTTRRHVYVGQPNLNRIIVMDGLKFEIVAIINTEPQPRKLFLYKPAKVHLSKWVRRRLSPMANARWLSAIGTRAHPLKSTPADSVSYSSGGPSSPSAAAAQNGAGGTPSPGSSSSSRTTLPTTRGRRWSQDQQSSTTAATSTQPADQMPSSLIQHDIWLLCYGQPLVVDPSGQADETPPPAPPASFVANIVGAGDGDSSGASSNSLPTGGANGSLAAVKPPLWPASLGPPPIQPFTPRLSSAGVGGGNPFAWPPSVWPASANREARLRNRKSVHIIQSTFFPQSAALHLNHHHQESRHRHHQYHESDGAEQDQEGSEQLLSHLQMMNRGENDSVVGEFKRSMVLTTHHIFSGLPASGHSKHRQQQHSIRQHHNHNHHQHQQQPHYLAARQPRGFDLIQDLSVPPKPYSLERNEHHKIHYAYVTHYNERRLFRVSMDEYRYDREIDLQNCDPIHLITTAQGLLVVQCRSPITHNLIGQMVLDQLTSAQVEFNANIRAQESYLSPDNRYLVSIYTNSTPAAPTSGKSESPLSSPSSSMGNAQRRARAASSSSDDPAATPQPIPRRQSIVYVQSVSVSGLKFNYEIKTSLEISQCSFVWKDGYYAAIFVSTNRRDQQSEILSLRLADSRLELMARVPGLISSARHKDQLVVSPELRLAALSTNQGTFVVDLEDNRVSQSLRHHQSPPTLLWL